MTPKGVRLKVGRQGTTCRGLLCYVTEYGHYIEWKEKPSRILFLVLFFNSRTFNFNFNLFFIG